MESQQLLACALDIGEQMLISGAEVGRVEAAIRFICTAYGCSRTDVFTITSSIVVSAAWPDGSHATQTRRITGTRTDLTRLHRLNSLSREIYADRPSYEYVQTRLSEICTQKPYPLWLEALGSALIAFSFAVFFGGTMTDGAVVDGEGKTHKTVYSSCMYPEGRKYILKPNGRLCVRSFSLSDFEFSRNRIFCLEVL